MRRIERGARPTPWALLLALGLLAGLGSMPAAIAWSGMAPATRALPVGVPAWRAVADGPALDEAEARAARAVVEAQLAAMAAGDDALAFAHASPAIQAQFGSAERFMAMVRAGYPMVIRPAATAFFRAERIDGHVLLRVQLRDPEGQRWLALYELLPLAEGWRINGCVVRRDAGGPGA